MNNVEKYCRAGQAMDDNMAYFRYVDDTLVVYNCSDTDIQTVLDQFNDTSQTLSFTMEMEKKNNINLLHISVLESNESLEFKIYRKPTTTDTIIHQTPTTLRNKNFPLSGS